MVWNFIVVSLLLLALLLLPFVLLYLRRRWLTGQGGLFDCAYRAPEGNWVLGMARYRNENLEWFRSFALSLSPQQIFNRTTTASTQRRSPEGVEKIALFDDSVIVTVQDRFSGEISELSMAGQEVLALMSWLESAPPGSHYVPSSAESPL